MKQFSPEKIASQFNGAGNLAISKVFFWRRFKKVNKLTFFTFAVLIWIIGMILIIYTLKHPKGALAAWPAPYRPRTIRFGTGAYQLVLPRMVLGMDDNWALKT